MLFSFWNDFFLFVLKWMLNQCKTCTHIYQISLNSFTFTLSISVIFHLHWSTVSGSDGFISIYPYILCMRDFSSGYSASTGIASNFGSSRNIRMPFFSFLALSFVDAYLIKRLIISVAQYGIPLTLFTIYIDFHFLKWRSTTNESSESKCIQC